MKLKTFTLTAILVVCALTAFAQDLKIDYQVKVGDADTANYFSFAGPIRLVSAEKDQLDSKTSASMKSSTELFQAYKYDVKGKSVLADGLRGLFLFAVATYDNQKGDVLNVNKAGNGVITVQYVHRGTAYLLATDNAGKLSLTNGAFKKRVVGYIKGEGPQVIHKTFSADGTAAKIDWKKVWDEKIAGGEEFGAGVTTKTGTVSADSAAADSMFYWDGALQVTYEKQILKISGGANAVKR